MISLKDHFQLLHPYCQDMDGDTTSITLLSFKALTSTTTCGLVFREVEPYLLQHESGIVLGSYISTFPHILTNPTVSFRLQSGIFFLNLSNFLSG